MGAAAESPVCSIVIFCGILFFIVNVCVWGVV